jgi:hypothetical protein
MSKPKTNLELLDFIFEQMEKLDKNIIDVEHAKAQSNLAKQANNSLRYELDLVNTKMKMKVHNITHNDTIDINTK